MGMKLKYTNRKALKANRRNSYTGRRTLSFTMPMGRTILSVLWHPTTCCWDLHHCTRELPFWLSRSSSLIVYPWHHSGCIWRHLPCLWYHAFGLLVLLFTCEIILAASMAHVPDAKTLLLPLGYFYLQWSPFLLHLITWSQPFRPS